MHWDSPGSSPLHPPFPFEEDLCLIHHWRSQVQLELNALISMLIAPSAWPQCVRKPGLPNWWMLNIAGIPLQCWTASVPWALRPEWSLSAAQTDITLMHRHTLKQFYKSTWGLTYEYTCNTHTCMHGAVMWKKIHMHVNTHANNRQTCRVWPQAVGISVVLRKAEIRVKAWWIQLRAAEYQFRSWLQKLWTRHSGLLIAHIDQWFELCCNLSINKVFFRHDGFWFFVLYYYFHSMHFFYTTSVNYVSQEGMFL